MDYIIATQNKKKRDEMQRILAPLGIRVLLAEEAGRASESNIITIEESVAPAIDEDAVTESVGDHFEAEVAEKRAAEEAKATKKALRRAEREIERQQRLPHAADQSADEEGQQHIAPQRRGRHLAFDIVCIFLFAHFHCR